VFSVETVESIVLSDQLLLTDRSQVLRTSNVVRLLAAVRQVPWTAWSHAMETAIHQDGKLVSSSVTDVEPVAATHHSRMCSRVQHSL